MKTCCLGIIEQDGSGRSGEKMCNIVGCGVLCDSTGIGVGVQACENWPVLGSYIVMP